MTHDKDCSINLDASPRFDCDCSQKTPMIEPQKMGLKEVMRLIRVLEVHGALVTERCTAINVNRYDETAKELFQALTAIIEQRDQAQRRLVDVLLKQAVNETAEVRKRLLESENIPAELWEMRFK